MILGIDLGQKTTGLAISSGTIATPFKTIKHQSISEAVDRVSRICEDEQVDKIVLGFVEGKIKNIFLDFAEKFKVKNPNVQVVMVDETLTSRQATQTMINISLPKGKRALREHEIAAALILQEYLGNL